MDHHMGGFHPSMGQPPPQLMNQPPQIFGDYHGLPMQHLPPELTAQMFGDPNALLDDANEAKRRRIARVSFPGFRGTTLQPHLASFTQVHTDQPCHRPAICVEKRRSSAMERCQLALTA